MTHHSQAYAVGTQRPPYSQVTCLHIQNVWFTPTHCSHSHPVSRHLPLTRGTHNCRVKLQASIHPPNMYHASSHQLLHIFISHPQIENQFRACSILRRPGATAAHRRRRRAHAAPRATHPGDRRQQAGRRFEAVCALLLHTSPSDATPHHILTSPLFNSSHSSTVNVEVPGVKRRQGTIQMVLFFFWMVP